MTRHSELCGVCEAPAVGRSVAGMSLCGECLAVDVEFAPAVLEARGRRLFARDDDEADDVDRLSQIVSWLRAIEGEPVPPEPGIRRQP